MDSLIDFCIVFVLYIYVCCVKRVPVKMIERSLFSTMNVFAENCRRRYILLNFFLLFLFLFCLF